ncbi:hypothetical protein RJT34_30522 [Clitoria ternatea]|uniref:Uncharacterized protein n=1 Tax=Clitoria ternatea TaxID=43366 RepID=A0AAN9EUN6_CLITE
MHYWSYPVGTVVLFLGPRVPTQPDTLTHTLVSVASMRCHCPHHHRPLFRFSYFHAVLPFSLLILFTVKPYITLATSPLTPPLSSLLGFSFSIFKISLPHLLLLFLFLSVMRIKK